VPVKLVPVWLPPWIITTGYGWATFCGTWNSTYMWPTVGEPSRLVSMAPPTKNQPCLAITSGSVWARAPAIDSSAALAAISTVDAAHNAMFSNMVSKPG